MAKSERLLVTSTFSMGAMLYKYEREYVLKDLRNDWIFDIKIFV